MTVNRKEKDENRAYAATHGISYTAAKRILDAVRNKKTDDKGENHGQA